jgi:SAM-dependent methyltransferase
MNFLNKIPFSYLNIVNKAIGRNTKTVLDLGCGKGIITKEISQGENWVITGVELEEDYVDEARKSGVYKEVVKGDVASLPKSILNRKFDVVLCLQVIEHINKEKGKKALLTWERLAKKHIVIATPVGFIPYEKIQDVPNEKKSLLTHRSGWYPGEFMKRGYHVYGQGWRLIYRDKGLASRFPKRLRFVVELLSYLVSPFIYFFPSAGQVMICKKVKR